MRQIFGESFNDFLRQIGSEHSAEIQEVAKRRKLDTSIEAKYLEAVEEFLAEKASLGVEDGTTWQKICAAFRQFLRNMGLNIAYSDNDIQQLFRQSLRAVQQQSARTGNNNGVRFNIGNDNSIDPEVRQAFPKYRSSQAKEVLKSIAGKDLKNLDTGIEAQINTNQYNKLISNAAAQKSENNGFSRDEHFEALANIEELYQNAILLKKTDDLKNNDPNVKIYRFASPFVIDNEIADALLTVKESIDNNSKKIYSLELTEIKKLSAKGGTLEYHTDSINKLQQKHEKVKQFLEKNQEKMRFSIAPQVDTPEFKNWFGDSKVVDENGKPLVLYHQTGNDFTVFDTEKQTHSKGDYETPIGIFLKPNDKDIGFKGKKQMVLYAKISNPKVFFNRASIKQFAMNNKQYHDLILTIEDNDRKYHQLTEEIDKELTDFYIQWRKNKFAGKLEFENIDDDPEYQKLTKRQDEIFEEWGKENDTLGNQARRILSDMLKQEGHDGIVIKEDAGSFGRRTTTYIAFSPTQIKSATDNVGTFAPDNPDIRFSENQRIDDQKMNAWAKMLQKIVNPTFNDFQYCEEFMLKNGINYIPARDARTLNAALVMAKDAVRERNKRFANLNQQRFMRKKDQFYNVLSSAYGENFTLNAGEKFDGVSVRY